MKWSNNGVGGQSERARASAKAMKNMWQRYESEEIECTHMHMHGIAYMRAVDREK